MAASKSRFNILIIGQSGRVGAEAALFAASLRHSDREFGGRVIVAEPQPGPMWKEDPRMADETLDVFERLKVEVVPLHSEHFGTGYPHGNKIEALKLLPKGRTFRVF